MNRPLVDRVSSWMLRARGFERRSVETTRGRVSAFVSNGDGDLPPVVFLHGIAACAADLGGVLLHVRPHVRRTIAIDFPGHGESEAPAPAPAAVFEMLREALDALLDEPSFLFGNSLGGFAAIRYTNQRPERVRGLFLSSPGGAASDPDTLEEFVRRFRDAGGKQNGAFVRALYESPPWYLPLVSNVVRRRFANPWLRATIDATSADDMLAPGEVSSLACPVLVVWGKRDRTQPPEQLDFFKAHLPTHACVEEPAQYTHCPQLERPRELADRIVTFVREATAKSTGGEPRACVQDRGAFFVGDRAGA